MRFLSILFCVSLFVSTISFADDISSNSQTLNEVITNKASVRTDSLGLATGLYVIYKGVKAYKANNMVDAVTSGALGLSTALGAVTVVSHAKEFNDPLKAFKETDDYKKIVDGLGEERAEEFTLDVMAGWDLRHLNEKYGTTDEDLIDDEFGDLTVDNLSRFLEKAKQDDSSDNISERSRAGSISK